MSNKIDHNGSSNVEGGEGAILANVRKLRNIIAPGRPSTKMTPALAAIAKGLRREGYYNHQIASMLGCNQGRIAEINRGMIFPEVPAE